jgi:hypoxanthine-DNA glycosylase
MTSSNEKTGLAAIIDDEATLLILGSLPSDASIRRQQYYGHPRNRFWPILFRLFGEELPADDYAAKVAFLHAHHIALWDVLHQAQRAGSADANISAGVLNDIPALLRAHPRIRTIALNGKTAEKTFRTHFADRIDPDIRVLVLKSTSPANAQFSMEELVAEWGKVVG